MNFDSAQSILVELGTMLLSQQAGMHNRTLINKLFNGDSPYTDEERRAENIKFNVNWLEGTRIAQNAVAQINNAFFKADKYFTVRLDTGPISKRQQWSTSITKHLNRELKRSRAYKSNRESAHAQVILHGPGPLCWRNRRTPIPEAAGVDDVLLPAGTLASMSNLDRFGIYREMTWNQLYEASQGKAADPGWNKDYVKALLATLYDTGVVPIYQGNRWLFPEKIAEDIKEGAAQMASNSLPKVLAWDFFYRDEDTGKFNRKLIVDYNNISAIGLEEKHEVVRNKEVLYEKEGYADDWQEIVHWYIGNCSNVAPYRYYSIRSIGYLLYGVVMIQNKLRNKLNEHMFQSLLTLFRNVSEDNREKLQFIDLQNFGVIPDGVTMVQAQERHEVDWNLILMGLNQGRQLMAESASSFVPDDPGGPGQKTMTATETLVRQNKSTTLTSAVLGQLGDQSVFEYREICRRFCIKNNPDPMVKRFREAVQREGVPMSALDCEAWEILPELTVGGGNKAVELTVTQALMQEMLPLCDPNGQRIIERRRYLALTDNPDEAMEVFPDGPQPPNDDVQYAQFAFSILMLGMPFLQKEGVNHVAFTAVLMEQLKMKLQQAQSAMQQPQGISTAAEWISGLFNVAQHIQNELQVIGQAEARKEIAKQMVKAFAEIASELQRTAQELMAMEQQQQPQGMDPEVQAKIQERMIMAQTNAQISASKAQQKQQEKDIAFANENMRRNAMTQMEIQRKIALTHTDIAATDLTTAAEIRRGEMEPAETE